MNAMPQHTVPQHGRYHRRSSDAAGLPVCLAAMAARIEHDFRRWGQFAKTPRIASAFARRRDRTDAYLGRRDLRVQVRQRAPRNTHAGCPRSWPSACWPTSPWHASLLSRADLRPSAPQRHSAMVARHLARPESRTMAIIGNGAQARVPGAGLPSPARDQDRAVRHRHGRVRQARAQSRRQHAVAIEPLRGARGRRVRGRRYLTTHHGRQAERDHPDDRHARAGMHINAVGRRLPRQDRAAPRRAAARDGLRGVSSRRPASRATSSRCRPTSRSRSLARAQARPAAADSERGRRCSIQWASRSRTSPPST